MRGYVTKAIYKLGPHSFWAQRKDENPSSPTPDALAPIFRLGVALAIGF
jgi:hypothetical protein